MSFDSGVWLQEVAENVDRLTIEQLLGLHELVVGPLCPATKRRIVEAMAAKPAPCRAPELTAPKQWQLAGLPLCCATAWDFGTDLRNTGRIAPVIRRTFSVRLHRAHQGRLLTTLGWSSQKPERRA